MEQSPGVLQELIEALRCLPGIGPKSARRMTYALLGGDRKAAAHLARSLQRAIDTIGHCRQCRDLTEGDLCRRCADPARDITRLCVVESPADLEAVEQTGTYRGHYFVLLGHLSPLDGVGPAELGIDQLLARLDTGTVEEVILATNATVEGEATARYIGQLASTRGITCTRIAHGVPMGGELEFADANTLRQALQGRRGWQG